MKLSRIVCATDFSEASQATLAQAAALAEWERAELHVLSVGPDADYAYRTVPRDVGTSDRENDAPCHNGERGVVLDLRTRKSPRAIVQAAQEIRADLVVVGTTVPHAGLSDRGWLAEAVAYEAHCPTLIVPSELAPTPEHLPFKNILCPVDFSPGSVFGLEKALCLAQRAEGALTVVHVIDETEEERSRQTRWNPPPDESMRGGDALYRMWSAIPDDAVNWCTIDARVTAGPPSARIVSTAYSVSANLIVMGVTGRRPFGGLPVDSTLRCVAADSTCPILVLRAPIETAAWDREYLSNAVCKPRLYGKGC
jgi:nucleotide-binding universal stress UspA family protein